MTNLVKLEKKLRDKDILNLEVTKDKKKYYVLHICRNGMPVPLFYTEVKKELLKYLNVHYDI
jgi:hypothetical protein